jgi:hypothetical protein
VPDWKPRTEFKWNKTLKGGPKTSPQKDEAWESMTSVHSTWSSTSGSTNGLVSKGKGDSQLSPPWVSFLSPTSLALRHHGAQQSLQYHGRPPDQPRTLYCYTNLCLPWLPGSTAVLEGIKHSPHWTWWCIPKIPILGRLRQEDCLRPAWLHCETMSKKNKKEHTYTPLFHNALIHHWKLPKFTSNTWQEVNENALLFSW